MQEPCSATPATTRSPRPTRRTRRRTERLAPLPVAERGSAGTCRPAGNVGGRIYRAGMTDDSVLAWSCAANLSLYDEDPGPRETNVGSSREPLVIDRRDALLEVYARQILVGCDADLGRLTALRADCQRRAAQARTLQAGWETVRWRRASPCQMSWPRALTALTPWSRREIGGLWLVGAQLADRAASRVLEADAAHDGPARTRLLASVRHSLHCDVLGAFLPADVEDQLATDLADTLREIDDAENQRRDIE